MASLKYLIRIVKTSSLKRMWKDVETVHQKTGKNKVLIFLDMLCCVLLHGAGYHEYVIFAMYDVEWRNRKTYMTRFRSRKLIDMVNDSQYNDLFDKKSLFDQRFAKYLGRDFLVIKDMTEESLAKFLEGKEVVFAKPDDGECGKGIERIVVKDHPDISKLYEFLKDPEKELGVVEDSIEQHPDMARLYPLSVNSMRIVTIIGDDKQPHIVYIVCKMGNSGKYVDNMENGGLACPVDPETGIMTEAANTSVLTYYEEHPYTGVKLRGYQLPYVKEAVELAKQAAMEVPEMGFLGWDVAITPTGPVIIEGNNYPGDYYQMSEIHPNRLGTRAQIKKYVKRA